MTLNERIEALIEWGRDLSLPIEIIELAYQKNNWFTPENQSEALCAIKNDYLKKERLYKWISSYDIKNHVTPKTIAIVAAGNLPLVSIHDLISVFISGSISMIKLSEKDSILIPYVLDRLFKLDSRTSKYFLTVPKLSGFDAVIATGSDNSARYFEYYFGKYPHIIRKNRNGIAILNGKETKEELRLLGKDIFSFFGLGCRNISKLYVPKNYDFTPLLEVLFDFKEIMNHNKYKNNFDYNYAILLLGKEKFLSNGCIILKEETKISSPIGVVYYEYYETISEIEIDPQKTQCIVSKKDLPFGQAQHPNLWDYADGIDTVQFILNLYQ
ncbi:MAG: hypothetical protein RJA52_466 [Bacteroidota bacterium]